MIKRGDGDHEDMLGVRRHALIETKGTPSLGMFERSPTVSRDLRNEGSHVSRAEAIHCKRKRPLCMHPPVPAVPSRAVWRPHLSLCSPDTSSTTLSFRTLAGRRRWRERGGPGYSTRSEKAPACHLQRAARQRAAHRQNEGQGVALIAGTQKWRFTSTLPYHPLVLRSHTL